MVLGLGIGVSPIAIYVYIMVRAGRRSRSEERAGLVKLGVGSRLQLMNFVRTRIEGKD